MVVAQEGAPSFTTITTATAHAMALYFSNHQSLIKDCYPLKQLLLTPLATLRADSNSLSKLTFYASGRPKKLPKVATVVMERAERDARMSGARARADLVVTVDIMRGLVEECRHELRCFASQAMRVVLVALGRRLNGTAVGERDTEMEARAAGLVSRLISPLHVVFCVWTDGRLCLRTSVSCDCCLYDWTFLGAGRRVGSAVSRLLVRHLGHGSIGV